MWRPRGAGEAIDGGGQAGHGDHGKESFSSGSGKAKQTDKIRISSRFGEASRSGFWIELLWEEGTRLHEMVCERNRSRSWSGARSANLVQLFNLTGARRLLELTENLPVRVEIVDIPERIETLLAALDTMIDEGLLNVAGVRIARYLPDPKT
jgi:PII-like signaling protein